jgi:hypothetical protein
MVAFDLSGSTLDLRFSGLKPKFALAFGKATIITAKLG